MNPNENTNENPNPTQAMVPTSPQSAPGAIQLPNSGGQMVPQWDDPSSRIWTNLAADDPHAEYVLTACAGAADLKTRNAVGRKLRLVGYAAGLVDLTDQATGELLTKWRVVLLEEDGGTISTCSEPVIRALRYLSQRRGAGRWNPPIECELRETQTSDGKSYCTLVLAKPSAPPAATKKR